MIKVTSKLHHILETLSNVGVKLTVTEKMVFDCTALGMSIDETAEELQVTWHTVKNHRTSSLEKTGFFSQRELMQTVIDSLQRRDSA